MQAPRDGARVHRRLRAGASWSFQITDNIQKSLGPMSSPKEQGTENQHQKGDRAVNFQKVPRDLMCT